MGQQSKSEGAVPALCKVLHATRVTDLHIVPAAMQQPNLKVGPQLASNTAKDCTSPISNEQTYQAALDPELINSSYAAACKVTVMARAVCYACSICHCLSVLSKVWPGKALDT